MQEGRWSPAIVSAPQGAIVHLILLLELQIIPPTFPYIPSVPSHLAALDLTHTGFI